MPYKHKADRTKAKRRHRARLRDMWDGLTDEEVRVLAGEKGCIPCGRTLPAEDFSINRSSKEGLATYCQTCKIIADRVRQARREGIPGTLTWHEIGDPPDECPCCGVRMERGGHQRNSPSLDRLVPELGYTEQNATWLCYACNAAKQNLGPAQLYALGDWLWGEMKRRGLPVPPTRLRPEEKDE